MIKLPNERIFLSADLPYAHIRNWRNTPEIYHWCRQYTDISENYHEQWTKKIESDPRIRMFGIYRITDGEGIGVCGLTSIDHVNQSAEFSLYIAPSHQKKGCGESALRTLVHHGFTAFNLNRIWGEVFMGNPAMTMFQKLGFKVEGILRQSYFRQGKFIDTTIISALREETCLSAA